MFVVPSRLIPCFGAIALLVLTAGCGSSDSEAASGDGGVDAAQGQDASADATPADDAAQGEDAATQPEASAEAAVEAAAEAGVDGPVATIVTTMGTIRVQLNETASPITVENFKKYADAAYFDGLLFHRVIPDFMIQGGGLEPGLKSRQTLYPPIVNEAKTSGLSNVRGAIAMARTSAPNSATSQFFINTADNTFLDPGTDNPDGYAAFGYVVEGMDVVDAIVAVPTHTVGQYDDVPVEDVVIQTLTVEAK